MATVHRSGVCNFLAQVAWVWELRFNNRQSHVSFSRRVGNDPPWYDKYVSTDREVLARLSRGDQHAR